MFLIPNDDPILHQRAEEVDADEFETMLANAKRMHEIRHEGGGAGLAAPQVGISKRMFVIDHGGRRFTCINPEIIKAEGEQETQVEGCLSYGGLPGANVTRWKRIKVLYYDESGSRKRHYMDGFVARVFQHELDHLDGIVHYDRSVEQGHITEEERPA